MSAVDDELLVQRLTSTGIAAGIASDLVQRHRGRCDEQLRYLPLRPRSIRDVAAYLRLAIARDFAPPKLAGPN